MCCCGRCTSERWILFTKVDRLQSHPPLRRVWTCTSCFSLCVGVGSTNEKLERTNFIKAVSNCLPWVLQKPCCSHHAIVQTAGDVLVRGRPDQCVKATKTLEVARRLNRRMLCKLSADLYHHSVWFYHRDAGFGSPCSSHADVSVLPASSRSAVITLAFDKYPPAFLPRFGSGPRLWQSYY